MPSGAGARMVEPGRSGPVLATDLDGTMALGSPAARERLMAALRTAGDATLIYVTGRTPAAVASLMASTPLPEPDVLIADVGTSVLRGMGPERVEAVEAELDRLWPGSDVVRERLQGLDGLSEQDVAAPRRVSYWIERVRRMGAGAGDPGSDPYRARSPGDPTLGPEAEELAGRVAERAVARLEGLGVDVVVSANVFLDVLPRGVDKGSTLRRVLGWLGALEETCVVAGDSLNDLALFETGLRGIVVGNCEPALRRRVAGLDSVYQAGGEGVVGILEGLRHHGVVPRGGEGGGADGASGANGANGAESGRGERMASDFIVLAHREPYQEVLTGEGESELRRKTNGVFTTLDSVMRQRRGTWIAWKERGDEAFPERVRVPSEEDPEAYMVRRIPLDPAEAERFYYDFTSTALWPVLFSLLDRARFTGDSWDTYRRVNQAFADATCEEAAPDALVWVNDFHLMLAPKMIKQKRPDLRLALFLHTTFPPADVFGVIPWREQLLDGLLHLDLIGFQIPSYAQNFADTAARFMDAQATSVTGTDMIHHGPAVAVPRYPVGVRYGDHTVGLGVYPVGVDVEYFAAQAQLEETREHAREVRQRTGAKTLILAAERLDYVKGILERLEAFERYLHRHPERHGEISFIQVAVPTRTGMDEFQRMRRSVEEAVGRINGQFASMDWRPVIHFYGSLERQELVGFYLAADIAWVTPLRDGLNLVVKEYIASRTGGEGMVILSEFAGAAAELDGVVLTNPYSPDDMDRALEEALTMSEGERTARMLRLRDRVLANDVHRWAGTFLNDAERTQPARAL